jgi:uncharacterized protein YbcV (DUF1398 family)
MSDLTGIVAAVQQRALGVRPVVGGFPYLAEVLRQAGAVDYEVDLHGRTSIYRSADGLEQVEHYPAVELPHAT